jgi:hypothetical protein
MKIETNAEHTLYVPYVFRKALIFRNRRIGEISFKTAKTCNLCLSRCFLNDFTSMRRKTIGQKAEARNTACWPTNRHDYQSDIVRRYDSVRLILSTRLGWQRIFPVHFYLHEEALR